MSGPEAWQKTEVGQMAEGGQKFLVSHMPELLIDHGWSDARVWAEV